MGEILGNRYEIKKLIGEGGMALVYLAQDILLDRPVAIKVLRLEYSSDQEFLERFQREAKSAAKLCHPNVVNIYDVGQTNSTYYIVMEYVEGTSLKDLIKKEGMLSVELTLKIAMQISSALNHAHNNLIVHRDIKPHNIMITKDYRVKVMDFGIARAISSATITRTGVVLGSVHYFSPEQATGKEVTSSSDLYSLGIVIYEMLTGKVPFEGDTPVGIAYQHVQAEIPPLEEKRPDLPISVINIVTKALAKKAEDRFQNAYEMEQALNQVLEQLHDPDFEKAAPTKINIYEPKKTMQSLPNKENDLDSTTIFNHTMPYLPDERDIAKMSKNKSKKKGSSKPLALTAILIIIAILLPSYFFLKISAFFNVPEVKVPNIVNLSQDKAKEQLKAKQLLLEIEAEVFDSVVPKGYIISQIPEADRLVKINRRIKVILSKGPELLNVPDLTDMDIRGAQVKLQAMALDTGEREYIETDAYAPGKIIGQFPLPNDEVERGTKINLQISKAPLTQTFKMPNLIDTTLYEAKLTLSRNNLELGEIFIEYNSYLPEGYVLDHNPAPEAEVVEGDVVDLTISAKRTSPGIDGGQNSTEPELRGRKEREVSILVTRPGLVKIVVIDEKGSHDVYRNEHRENDYIQKIVGGTGVDGNPDVFVQVWLNNEMLRETVLTEVTM